MKKIFFTSFIIILLSLPAHAFNFDFDWSGLKKCTSGNPNRVQNPIFYLNDLPENTKLIIFKLKDKDVPNYNHGGGKVKMDSILEIKEGETNYGKYDYVIKPGSFKYKSPCPPDGKHTYEWTADVRNSDNKKSGKSTSQKKYP